MLEGRNSAQNVANLDGLVSLGKLSVTEKEFQFVRDENNSDVQWEYLARAQKEINHNLTNPI